MASGQRAPSRRSATPALPSEDMAAAQASVEQAAAAEIHLDSKLSRYDDDLQRVRGAIAKNADAVNDLNQGVSVAATKKKSPPAKKASAENATAKTVPSTKASAKTMPSKRASANTAATTSGKTASSRSAAKTSAPTKPVSSKPTRKKAAPKKAAPKTATPKKAASGKSAAGKSLPTKKQIGQARVVLTEIRAQEKKLAKKLDRHTANLRDLKHDLKTSEKDVTKVEAKLDQSKRSRQRAQEELKNLQS